MFNVKQLSKNLSRKGLYDFLNLEFDKIKANQTVLTIGSEGEIHRLLKNYSIKNRFKVISFDIDSNKNPDIIGDICRYEFNEEDFDYVVICEVLEHLHSPQSGIDNIHKILKPEGRLILTTPFILPIHDRPYDYYRFTKFGLEFLLRNFDKVKIKERNSYFEAIDVLWVRILQTQHKKSYLISKFIIPFIYYVKRPFSILLSKLIKLDEMTTGYVVTASKN